MIQVTLQQRTSQMNNKYIIYTFTSAICLAQYSMAEGIMEQQSYEAPLIKPSEEGTQIHDIAPTTPELETQPSVNTTTTIDYPTNEKKQEAITEQYPLPIPENISQPQASAPTIQDCGTDPVKVSGFNAQYSGTCINGLASGLGMAKGIKGVYEGNFLEGYFNGQGRLKSYLDGKEYKGNFSNGKLEGLVYTLDKESGYIRAALFENDRFVSWQDELTSHSIPSIGTPRHIQPPSTPSSSKDKPTGKAELYIGTQTPYGEVVSWDEKTFTVNQTVYDKNGSQRIQRKRYPLYLLPK